MTIVVDWGSSSFRAWRTAGGALAEERRAAAGISTVVDGAFAAALEREIGDWLAPGVDVRFSGMIGSRNGWVETAYVDTPARLADLLPAAVTRGGPRGSRLFFLPGVAQRAPRPDVMRGEEIQVFGALDASEGLIVLPGTHSKWVRVEGGAITAFRTFMTGELFAVARAHTLVGRLIAADDAADGQAFAAGVRQGLEGGTLGSELFALRAGALLGAHPAAGLTDRLSGLLIGAEIAAGLAEAANRTPLLVGEAALVERYATAFAIAGVAARIGPADAVLRGFSKLAQL